MENDLCKFSFIFNVNYQIFQKSSSALSISTDESVKYLKQAQLKEKQLNKVTIYSSESRFSKEL